MSYKVDRRICPSVHIQTCIERAVQRTKILGITESSNVLSTQININNLVAEIDEAEMKAAKQAEIRRKKEQNKFQRLEL